MKILKINTFEINLARLFKETQIKYLKKLEK